MYVRYYNGSYPTLYVELIEYEDYVTPQLFKVAGDNQIYQRVNTDIIGSKKCYLCAFQHLTKHCYSAPTCGRNADVKMYDNVEYYKVVGTTSCSAYYMRYEGIPIEYIDSPNIDVINI